MSPSHACDTAAIIRPLCTVDVVIFTVLDKQLHVLLVKRPQIPDEPFPDCWALPGGFVDVAQDADLTSCALRKLQQKTGVPSPYLEQVGSWGGKLRDPRGWSVTNVYFALIPTPAKLQHHAGAMWFPIAAQQVSVTLAFDHRQILEAAVQRLRNKVEYTSLPAFLLPEEFTLGDLQQMYEIVLARSLEKSAFRTRILAADLVQAIEKNRTGANRPAQLYQLTPPREIVYFPRTLSPRK